MFSIKQLKKDALAQLKGHWGMPILLTAITAIISALTMAPFLTSYLSSTKRIVDVMQDYGFNFSLNYLQSLPFGLFFSSARTSFAMQALQVIIFGTLSIALYRYFLAFSKSSRETSFNTFLEGFNYWWKGILATLWKSLWLYLWQFACAAAFIASIFVFFIVMLAAVGIGSVQDTFPTALVAIGGGVLFLAGIAVGVILINRTIAYSFALFVQAENVHAPVRTALRASIAMTKGVRGKIFLLYLSFLGWALLACFTGGIGFLFLSPYFAVTGANLYRVLKERALKNGVFSTAQQPVIYL